MHRQQRSASAQGGPAAAAHGPKDAAHKQAQEVIVAYASQTGTAQEIARNIQAESSKHGVQSKASRMLSIDKCIAKLAQHYRQWWLDLIFCCVC